MREYKDGILERIYCNVCARRTDNLRTLSGLERQEQTEPFREIDWTYHYGSELYDFSGVKFDICEECVKVMEDDAVIPFDNNDYDVNDELGFDEEDGITVDISSELSDETLRALGKRIKKSEDGSYNGISWHGIRKDEEDDDMYEIEDDGLTVKGGNTENTVYTELIRSWAHDRNLHTADPKGQALKLGEEFGELFEGMAKDNEELIKDALGDMFVVMTILSEQLGFTIEECIEIAYDEIKDRRGKMIDGVFVKEDDLNDE